MIVEKKAGSFQTENKAEVCDSSSDTVEFSTENRKRYSMALKYVNNFNRTISSKLNELDVEGKTNAFRIPEVPDYAQWFEIIFKRQKKQKLEQDSGILNKNILSVSTPTFSEERTPLQKQTPRSEGSIIRQVTTSKDQEAHLNYHSDAGSQTMNLNRDDEINSRKPNDILDLIKDRLLKEFLLDCRNSEKCNKLMKETRLVKSCFSVVNIKPHVSLLDYAKKKLATSQDKLGATQKENTSTIEHAKPMNVRPNTPRRVKQMFDVISKDKVPSRKIFENKTFKSNLDFSDSDSVILDDEEFERMSHKSACPEEEDHMEYLHPERSNPLKLTGKDMTRLNEKMLSAIGLFTERGDVRPGVIDILEEQKKLKSNDSRNKQFRSKRQWDIQIHLKPNTELDPSLPSISSDKSFISLSSDIKLQVQNVESDLLVKKFVDRKTLM